ncbi:MAG: formylglycine-generating enzyme family protein [Planctomycetaceae bacterium]
MQATNAPQPGGGTVRVRSLVAFNPDDRASFASEFVFAGESIVCPIDVRPVTRSRPATRLRASAAGLLRRTSAALLVLPWLITGCGDAPRGVSVQPREAESALPEPATLLLSSEQQAIGAVEVNSIGMAFAPIPAGTFRMGTEESDPLRQDGESAHTVTLSNAFRLGVFAVTQQQYQRVMQSYSPALPDGRYPAVMVSWDVAVEFCKRLSNLPEELAAGRSYRLPTEAEWEYACRAGTSTAYSCGNDPVVLRDYSWFHDNALQRPHPVGEKLPNAWSLYDMHGNVFEWCRDSMAEYPSAAIVDPVTTGPGDVRVARGGSWYCLSSQLVRSAVRHGFRRSERTNYIGFRVILEIPSRDTHTQIDGAGLSRRTTLSHAGKAFRCESCIPAHSAG